jgi:hypothetical protein
VEICALVPSSLAGLLVQARLLQYFSAHVLGLTIDGHGDMCHEALVTNMAAGNEASAAGGG